MAGAKFLNDTRLQGCEKLQQFITKETTPNQEFFDESSKVIDVLYEYLQNELSSRNPVKSVIKVGSLGKGTAILENSDLDLVLFMAGFSSLFQFLEQLPTILAEVEVSLTHIPSPHFATQIKVTSRAVKFTFKRCATSPEIEVDLFPTLVIDMLEGNAIKDLYQNLKKLQEMGEFPFVANLMSLQAEFVEKQPPNVKRLIRLVKYWRKEYVIFDRGYPSSYPFELLTIYAWQQAGCPQHFDTAQGFCQVLTHLADHRNIKVFWLDYYSFDIINQSQLNADGPVIIDPANPTMNICKVWEPWNEVARRAREALNSPMMSTVEAKPGWV